MKSKFYFPSLFALSGLIGIVVWNGHVAALALLPIIVFLWCGANNRLQAFLLLFAYYLGAARGQLSGANIFFADGGEVWWIGLSVWISSSALLASVWSLLWGQNYRPLRLIGILVLLSIPPIGIFGWANPITAAGVLYPGFAWVGLFLTVALFCSLVQFRRIVFPLPFVFVAFVAQALYSPAALFNWYAIDTQLGSGNDPTTEYDRMRQLQAQVLKASSNAPSGAVFVLPEMVGGDWSKNGIWWDRVESRLRIKNQTVLIGASRPVADGGQINMLVSAGSASGKELIGRVPIPVAMWKPWEQKTNVRPNWFGDGISQLGSQKVASLICYEQLLIWPVLVSMAQDPDVLAAPANGWWARNTSIAETQKQTVNAWGRLFNVPIVFALNQ